ncbi:hypothetical protein CAPTEDRAFT_191591 [Capitella teleta]|uniref:Ig-like domain-containing protein n=1 Tax=Capitella teleta TaxID=283909 RepID=R7T7K6_CAPTE|nr:hypothetical protein CAPTEDRAFT_191591 [Capitella teleta]|eukprot:ELT87400.1 hypothetical protein CAPTEDRAFT_191591 [Capitella teleta]
MRLSIIMRLVYVLVLNCLVVCSAFIVDINEDENHIPLFRPLRRLVSNFGPGRRAQLTLVFQSDVDFDTRWFKSCDPGVRLPMAENPDMLPIKANDPNYKISSMHSGSVHALTMDIVGLQEKFPIKYVTIFSARNRPMQYHLTSIIPGPTERHLEQLDGIVWENVPRRSIVFEQSETVIISCVADFESYSGYTDEMHLFSTQFTRIRKNRYGFIKTRSCGHVHPAGDPFWEEAKNLWLTGSVLELDNGANRFNFTIKISNASRENQGIFTCAAEREHDKTFVNSWVKQGRPGSKPLVELVPCDGTNLKDETVPYQIKLKKRKPTCIRCRSFGYPDARMNFKKAGTILNRTPNIHLDFHHYRRKEEGSLS